MVEWSISESWKLRQLIYDGNRQWDYPESFGICSQFDRKSKTCSFTFLNMYIFWIERNKILISQFSSPKFRYLDHKYIIFRYLHTIKVQRWDLIKINFDNFQMEKWVFETVRARKADEKNGVIFPFFMSLFWVVVLKLSKIVSFLHFFADLSNKSKTVIAVYIYAFESSCSLF